MPKFKTPSYETLAEAQGALYELSKSFYSLLDIAIRDLMDEYKASTPNQLDLADVPTLQKLARLMVDRAVNFDEITLYLTPGEGPDEMAKSGAGGPWPDIHPPLSEPQRVKKLGTTFPVSSFHAEVLPEPLDEDELPYAEAPAPDNVDV